MNYDVFNGDADGLCALVQLRLAQPLVAQLITGVKRDIHLLAGVNAQPNSHISVLDISFQKNAVEVKRLLEQGAHIFYADHHQAGEIPIHRMLSTHIHLSAQTCTSLIISHLTQHRFQDWALVGAYGDNLSVIADRLVQKKGYNATQHQLLQQLGKLLNYNGYGRHLADLHHHPAELFRQLVHYLTPFDFIEDNQHLYQSLASAYQDDLAQAQRQTVHYQSQYLSLYMLPDEPAYHRVSGVYGNWLANQFPEKAHLIATWKDPHSLTLSLRAPLNNPQGAGQICSRFEQGGGRAAAGGINQLALEQLTQVISAVEAYYRT